MNIKELEQIIFKPSSNIMRKIGEEIYRNGLVSDIRGRKIENIYHIYGDVLNNINHNQLKTYIKINLSDKKIEEVSCACDEFKETSRAKKLVMCEHLTATAYKFLSLLNKKKDKKSESLKILPKEKIEKTEVGIGIKVTHKSWKGKTDYELEFRLGFQHKYLITDLKNFISNLDQEKKIYFNNQFTYNPKEHVISSDDIKVINFIREYVYANKGIWITRRSLIVSPDGLRKFLECIGKSKIIFKYNAIEYKTTVFKADVPISFTLKEKNECFILTTHKKLPIPLNEDRDVYFFNERLYLPSKNQVEKYSLVYDKLQKNGQIQYHKTIDNYNKIIYLLSSISKNITLTEEVKRFASNSLKFEFLIYKERTNIYCDVQGFYYNEKINILEEANSKTQIIRDFNKEEKILMKFEYYKFIKRKGRLIFVGEDEDLFNLLSSRKNSIYCLGTVILGEGLEDIKVYNAASIEVDLYEENGYFKFNYNIGNVDSGELKDIFESYKSENRFYKTKDNGFIDFEDQGVRSFLNLINILNTNKNIEEGSIQVEKNKALYIEEGLKNQDYKLGNGVNLLKDIKDKLTELNSKEITLSKNLKANLREYQVNGFKWFKSLSELGFGGILADDMGLGKKVQTIAFLTSEENKKSLIITPTSLIYNWKDELERFAPSIKVGILHGNAVKQQNIINKLEEYDVILTTYGTLRNNIRKYDNIEFDYCIIDEAQNIKNPVAQATKVVKEIKGKVRFALTGTLIENNLIELWSIFDFIMPGYLYSKETFYEKFISNSDCDLEGLRLLIKPFILRRTKREVIEK